MGPLAHGGAAMGARQAPGARIGVGLAAPLSPSAVFGGVAPDGMCCTIRSARLPDRQRHAARGKAG